MDTLNLIRSNALWIAAAVLLIGAGVWFTATDRLAAEQALAPGFLAGLALSGKIAYQSLKLSRSIEARARAIVDRAADAIITTDQHGRIESLNPATTEIFGYRTADLLGHEITTLLSSVYEDSEDDTGLWNFLRRNAIGVTGSAQEVIGLRNNGEKFFMELSISDAMIGNRIIFIAVIRDITSKKKAEIVVRRARDELEKRVEERTADLKSSNLRLKTEADERKRAQLEQEETLEELQQALQEIKTLSGFIPICASCKKVRDDDGFWNQIEEYISEHSDAHFSHGICPDCRDELYPELGEARD